MCACLFSPLTRSLAARNSSFPAFYIFQYFPLYAYAHKSVSEVISKLPKGASLAFENVLFHCRRAILVLGVDDDYPLKVLLRNKPSDFLPVPLKMELSACIQCRSWSRRSTFNSCFSNARNAASAFFAKTAFGIRFLNHEMRSSMSSTTRMG